MIDIGAVPQVYTPVGIGFCVSVGVGRRQTIHCICCRPMGYSGTLSGWSSASEVFSAGYNKITRQVMVWSSLVEKGMFNLQFQINVYTINTLLSMQDIRDTSL